MNAFRALAAAIAACAVAGASSPAAGAASDARPPASAAATSCPEAVPATALDALATPVHDRAELRFVRVLATATPAIREAVRLAVRRPVDGATARTIAQAFAGVPCADASVAASVGRMADAVSAGWNVTDDAEADALSDRLETIATALAARAALGSAVVDPLLAPFGTATAALDALDTAAPAGAACTAPDADARTIHIAPPEYPAIARAMVITGFARIDVHLNADGNVERVALAHDDLGDGAGANAIRLAALRSAATTLYAPAVVRCRPVPGTYEFRADFTRR